jgi:hypothetical protein
MRPGKRRVLAGHGWEQKLEWVEQIKASIRAKVEHPFHVVKNLFRHRKTRYRGLAKNTAQLHTLFAMANLVLARRLIFGCVSGILTANCLSFSQSATVDASGFAQELISSVLP